MKNKDMPAKPLINSHGVPVDYTNGTPDESYINQEGRTFSTGLTKFEEVSSRILAGIAAGPKECDSAAAVKFACKVADEYFEELEKRSKT